VLNQVWRRNIMRAEAKIEELESELER
jgi:hypothetical protein